MKSDPNLDAFSSGVRAGTYEIVRELGHGGMGKVLLARDTAVAGRLVALKAVLQSQGAISKEDILRFEREIKNLAALSHPNIVRVFNAGIHEGCPYFVMDYIEGRDFGKYLDEIKDHHGPVRIQRITSVMATVARAVHHAHSKGVVHRDLKPANIMIASEDDLPIVLDFGISKHLCDTNLTLGSMAPGTPLFSAPEQIDTAINGSGNAIDIWALGVVLYRAITGRQPFSGNDFFSLCASIRFSEPTQPGTLVEGLPPALNSIILACLEKSPASRPPSALALADQLDDVLRAQEASGLISHRDRDLANTLAVPRKTVRPTIFAKIWRAIWPGRDNHPMKSKSRDEAQWMHIGPVPTSTRESLSRRIFRIVACSFLGVPTVVMGVGVSLLFMLQTDGAVKQLDLLFSIALVVYGTAAWFAWRRRSALAFLTLVVCSLAPPIFVSSVLTNILLPEFGSHYSHYGAVGWLFLTCGPLLLASIPLGLSIVLVVMEHEPEQSMFQCAIFALRRSSRPRWLTWFRRAACLLFVACVITAISHRTIKAMNTPKPLFLHEEDYTIGSWEEDGSLGMLHMVKESLHDGVAEVWTFDSDRRLTCGLFVPEMNGFVGVRRPGFRQDHRREFRWRHDYEMGRGDVMTLEELKPDGERKEYVVKKKSVDEFELEEIDGYAHYVFRRVKRIEPPDDGILGL